MSEVKNGKHEDSGFIFWYVNGLLHREDGPAAVGLDVDCWYINGMRHREDGPAVEYEIGSEYDNEWWINGIQFTEQEFIQWKEKKKLNEKLHFTLEERPVHKKCKI